MDRGHCPRRGQVLQSVRLILTAWLDRPLGGLQIEGQQPSPPTHSVGIRFSSIITFSCRSFVGDLDQIKKVSL